MNNWSSRKRFENNSYPINTKKRRKKSYYYAEISAEDKENSMNYNNLKTNEKYTTAQYLYADPWFIKEANEKQQKRLEGGGLEGNEQQEVFYDCECEPDPQLQIFEIINEIKNPRQFKSLLKQMAFTSSVLYRTFRQAYSKAKKCNDGKPYNQMDCKDMNPLDIINIEIPRNKQEYLEEERIESSNKVKGEKKKSSSRRKYIEDQEQTGFICRSCQDTENKFDICLDPIKPETDVCCSQKPEDFNEINKEPVGKSSTEQECNFSSWFPPDSTCLVETNVCQQYDKELQNLDFCERCAVLRGEMPLPSTSTKEEAQVCEKSSQTCQKLKCCKNESCSKSSRPLKQAAKQVLNLNPVCVTIPLKLQIDSQNCQSRFIETEIVMEAFSGTQSKSVTCEDKDHTSPQTSQKIITTLTNSGEAKSFKSPALTPKKLQEKNCSDLFYSCVSTSGIIKPDETPPIQGETSLNEVLNIIKKRMPNAEEIPEPLTEKLSKTIGTRMSQPESVVATTMTAPTDRSSRTNFTQTEQTSLQTSQLDQKIKAQQLRADLLGEVRAALEQTTPIAALKALMEGKRFSLPTNLRPKETSNIKTPARQSLPANYQAPTATNTASKPLQPLQPLTATIKKPAFPPKPLLPTKPASFITDFVQTDASTIKASGHYKRNEMRSEIQEDLKDLLEPNRLKSKIKYNTEERDEILLDLHKLFHPERAGRLPKQISRENALQDINYLVKPETSAVVNANSPKTSDSQDSIIQSIKYILNPKSQQKSKKKKYDKETKEKILEDLQIILTPRQKKPEVNQEIRASVLHDLRFMLDTGLESTSPHRPPRLSQLQTVVDTGPSSSRAQEIRQQRQQKPPNEIRDSLIADLRYLLDITHPSQLTESNTLEQNVVSTRPAVKKPPEVPAKPKISNSLSSEGSLPDNDKKKDTPKVESTKQDGGRKQTTNKSEDLAITKSSSSDTFFIEMQDSRSSQ